MILDEAKNIAVLVGSLVTLFTLIKAVYEYTKQSAQKRAEEFFKLDKQFMENEDFAQIFSLLDHDSPELRNVDLIKKFTFLRFYENIALMVNSGLMKSHVAHYMFAYYAIRCWESENFWYEINRDSSYWALFVEFVKKMKKVESNFDFKSGNYRL